MHHHQAAIFDCRVLRYAQSMSGLSSSQVTHPSVACSIAMHRCTGTDRLPAFHCATMAAGMPSLAASFEAEPAGSR